MNAILSLFVGLPLALADANDNLPMIHPTHAVVHVQSEKALADWDYKFKNAKELSDSIRQGSFSDISSGEADNLLYVIYRDNQHLYLVVVPKAGGRFSDATLDISEQGGNQSGIANIKLMPVATTNVLGPTINSISHQKINVALNAYVTPIISNTIKKLKINFEGRTQSAVKGSLQTEISWN